MVKRESAAINKSLMALKDCFRESARARQAAKQPQSAAAHNSCMLVVTELTSSTV